MPSLSYKECCEILGIEENLPATKIKAAYRQLMLQQHPDKVPLSKREAFEERAKKINSAYETLGKHDYKKFQVAHENSYSFFKASIAQFIQELKINKSNPEQQAMFRKINQKLDDLSEKYDLSREASIIGELRILLAKLAQFISSTNNSYLPGNTPAEKNWNHSLAEICNSATLLCEKAIMAIEFGNSAAISHAQYIMTELRENSEFREKAALGLKSMKADSTENQSPINKLKQDIYDCGVEAASTLIQTYSTGFSQQINKMHVGRDGYSFSVSTKLQPSFRQARFEMEDLGKAMEKFRTKDMRNINIHLNNIRWDTTYWKKFKIAAAKLVTAIADTFAPTRNKTMFDALVSKGMFVGSTRQLANVMKMENHGKKNHRK